MIKGNQLSCTLAVVLAEFHKKIKLELDNQNTWIYTFTKMGMHVITIVG